MTSREQMKFWFSVLAVVVITGCILTIMAVWRAVTLPPQTDIQKARDSFISGCTDSIQSGWAQSNHGVPNTGSTNPKDWTCTFTK